MFNYDFLVNAAFLLLRIAEALACITGFIYFNKFRRTYWIVFVYFLLFIVVCENTSAILRGKEDSIDRFINLSYNYFVIPIEFLFYYWLFYRSFIKLKSRRLPIVFVGIYLASLFINSIYFNEQLYAFKSFSYTIGTLLLLVLILQFLSLLVTSDAILNFQRNGMFWVSSGLLIFFLASFPFYGMIHLVKGKNAIWFNYYYLLVTFLDCAMYILFSISFIWGEKPI